MSNEERPQLSLRLRGRSDTPAEAPPPVSMEQPPVPPPPAADSVPPSEPAPPLTLRKARLASLLTEPGDSAQIPVAPEATAAAAFDTPPPLPAAAYEPPAPAIAAPPSFPAPTKPIRPANFPPPPGFTTRKADHPAAASKARTAAANPDKRPGVALLLLLLLVVGVAAYLYLVDPLQLFQAAPLAATPAGAPAEAPIPVVPRPAPPIVAPAAAAPTEPASAIDAPAEEEPPYEPEPPPPPLPELKNIVSAFKISGARSNSAGGMVMIGTTAYQAGEIVDPIHDLVFVGFADGVMTFRDPRGALYPRKF